MSDPTPTKTYAKSRPKVPAFARFEGTSAWKKDRNRARAYARFKAQTRQADRAAPATA